MTYETLQYAIYIVYYFIGIVKIRPTVIIYFDKCFKKLHIELTFKFSDLAYVSFFSF